MPGPVPGIHVLRLRKAKDVDGRDEPGHDATVARRIGQRMVAGRERCHEEATRTAPCRPNPTDPGDAADLSIPQGYQ